MRTDSYLTRAHVAFSHDVVMAAFSFVLSLYLRLGDDLASAWDRLDLTLATLGFTLVAALVFLSHRMYRGVWRYASLHDMLRLTQACTMVILIFLAIMFLTTRLHALPRSVMVINWFVLMALLGGPRFLYRSFKDKTRRGSDTAIPVLLVGTGDDAELFLRAARAHDTEYRPVGLLTERGGQIGRHIHGIDVLGSVNELDQVVADLQARGKGPQRLIIADRDIDGAIVRRLLDQADTLGMTLARLPRMTELKEGIADEVTIRPIAVEDLLGRPQTVLDREAMAGLIRGRKVLVTGAGGSIGSELARQIADYSPQELVLLDAGEFNLYSIDLELGARFPDVARHALLGDVRDRERISEVFRKYRPQLVFHAAALKHVPMVEHNPTEGVLTNAVGTSIVAEACREAGVAMMVQISTDKAVNPTNVMGSSKRIAEMYAQALDLTGAEQGGTRFVTVRFGNVLGSTGSVVPLFQKQLAEGGPITVTHPEMTRFFMTVREAVELVMQASALGMGCSEHRGKIFVLDMGEPVKIVHLARQMIRLAGLRPDTDIKIVYTGLRPGEKLFEEIFHGAEPPVPTDRPGILVATPRAVDIAGLRHELNQLEAGCRAHDTDAVLGAVKRLVPEYGQPSAQESPPMETAR